MTALAENSPWTRAELHKTCCMLPRPLAKNPESWNHGYAGE